VPTLAEKFLNDSFADGNKNLKSQVRGLQAKAGRNDAYRHNPGPYKARVLKFEHLDSTQAPVHVGTSQGQTGWGQININDTEAGNTAYYRITYRLEDESTGPFDFALPAPTSADDHAAIDLHAHAGSILICNSTETGVLNYWDSIHVNFDPATRTNAVLVQPPAPAGTLTAQALVAGAGATASGAFGAGVGTATAGGPVQLSNVKDTSNSFIANGKEVKTGTNNIINIHSTWKGRLILPENCYTKWKGWKAKKNPIRPIKQICLHWDAAWSAETCFRVLAKKGISSHFAIDNRGEIYQYVDTQHITRHAGGPSNKRPEWEHWVNRDMIGIDLSINPSMAAQKKYTELHGKRPVITGAAVHGKKRTHLGFYDVQIRSLTALLKALCEHYGVPKACPIMPDGKLNTGFAPKGFLGILCHYSIRHDKYDVSGLDLVKIVKDIGG